MNKQEKVSFKRMDEGSASDYALLDEFETDYIKGLPDRIIHSLQRLEDTLGGYQVTRLQHSLQSATRAEADGADIELIVAALIHDIGDELAPENHSQLAACIIRPYVRAEVSWILEMHGVFQFKYYADKVGLNPDERERWRNHPWFDSCEQFCRDWDQVSFDPDYETKPLSYFEPMLRQVFSRPAFDRNITKEPI
ncbi:HD domain-containing protein [Alphaproteobacteria bacterium]|nr:HD domain-containing protein [Alphaproteobacteria bacterium]MDC0462056.1 HD domain-containing protein [Alphaproteobacteria bacterium]